MLKSGLYEQVINKEIADKLKNSTHIISQKSKLDKAEASKILAAYIAEVAEKGLLNLQDNGEDISSQIMLINKLISEIKNSIGERDFEELIVDTEGEQLLSIANVKNSIHAMDKTSEVIRPETSIAMSSLFTGAVHEPQMFTELKKEIISCDRIDMLVSFIKWSGLRLIIDELRAFTSKGGELRIITTSYMGATDIKAIEELRKLENTRIKVSYDTKRTRLHAKTYVFHRDTGFTTAYVGSSNMSNAALSSGLEWNVKLTYKDLATTIDKIEATFESYWNNSEFEYYNEGEKERLIKALSVEKYGENMEDTTFLFEVRPYGYQQEILDALRAEREVRGYFRNLVVAATGTGKTVISAFDYKNFVKSNGNKVSRFLFIAHREEILKQSLFTFRNILKDNNFGDMFTGNHKPEQIDHLFMSIQTFNSQEFINKTSQDFYDYIIVDEFHHAAASTYQKLLNYYEPKVFLGLTATPERMDGKSILSYFNDRIAAEIRLPEAIERKLLCPFQYFGVSDSVDLKDLRWSRGGYDKRELSNIYTLSGAVSERRAQNIASATLKYVTDINEVKGLGFCVSKEHAKFMSDAFNHYGIKSIALTSESPMEDRNSAKTLLVTGDVKFIFVVDLYNEGVDIPQINTVLFLRPTESLTVFLQQLGRGLRLSEDKECLTVLDFIGQANKKYNFEDKFSALLMNSNKSITKEVKEGFISLPKGCYIQLEKKAQKYILDNLKASFGQRAGLISRITHFYEETGLELTLKHFLDYYHLDIRTIYSKGSFSRLCVLAKVLPDFSEELEPILTKSFPRFQSINSRRLISFTLDVLQNNRESFTEREMRMLQMIHFTVYGKSVEECGFKSAYEGILKIKASKVMCAELCEILRYNFEHIDFIDQTVNVGFDTPLDLHCTYTRDQLLVALDFLKPNTVREGVKYLPNKNIDVLFVTLNKADKDYSPTTMYNDYSINDTLFHWQSQSTTSESSPTGQRYITHRNSSHKILLFVREFKNDQILRTASAYTFLGTAQYIKHEGSKPMNITWKLDRPIPSKFLKKTNKLVVC